MTRRLMAAPGIRPDIAERFRAVVARAERRVIEELDAIETDPHDSAPDAWNPSSKPREALIAGRAAQAVRPARKARRGRA